MAPRKSKSQVKQPAKKKAVNKATGSGGWTQERDEPKKGLAGAGSPRSLAEILRQSGVSSIRSTTTHPFPEPLRVAIEKFSLSLVSEGMLAMVAMHGILSNPQSALRPFIKNESTAENIAAEAVAYARAVMAELKNQKDSAK